jgi:AraC-like DNA-binding protein
LLLREEKLLPGQEFSAPCAMLNWRFFQITNGVAYWLATSSAREFQPGALVAVPPRVNGVVRASQLNETTVRHFCFSPQSVFGLFSLAERMEISQRVFDGALILPADHPAAQMAGKAPLPESPPNRLASRAHLLHAVLLVLAEHAQPAEDPLMRGASARRFQRLTSQALDVSLLTQSSEEIAEWCGCTQRHLHSLWRRELGEDLRSTRREIRLQLARKLIEQEGEKIAAIARSVGFTNVSRFNAAFKRLFGCTPTECRAVVAKS